MRTRTLLLAGGLSLLLAAPAAADSIVYEKGGDLWLADLDGSDQRAVTTGGGYRSPAQADDGTLAALHGRSIRRLRADGTVLSELPTVVLDHPNWFGPSSLDVAPDGTRLVYGWEYQHNEPTTPCPLYEDQCANRTRYGGATVSWSDRATGVKELGDLLGLAEPTWSGGERVVGRSRLYDSWASWAPVPANDGTAHWFIGTRPLRDPAVTRDGALSAWVFGWDQELIVVLKTAGAFPGRDDPTACFQLQNPAGRYAEPSFSPDGKTLVWQEDDGIWSANVPADCRPTGAQPRLLIPGGRSPDVGPGNTVITDPAVHPEPRPQPRPEPERPPVVTPPRPPQPPTEPPAPPRLAVAGRAPSLKALGRRRTLSLRLACAAECRASVTASVPRALARTLRLRSPRVASASASGRGAVTVRLTLPRTTAARLARSRKPVALTVAGTVTQAGVRTPLRLKLTLRR